MNQTSRTSFTSDRQFKRVLAVAVIIGIALNFIGIAWADDPLFTPQGFATVEEDLS